MIVLFLVVSISFKRYNFQNVTRCRENAHKYNNPKGYLQPLLLNALTTYSDVITIDNNIYERVFMEINYSFLMVMYRTLGYVIFLSRTVYPL